MVGLGSRNSVVASGCFCHLVTTLGRLRQGHFREWLHLMNSAHDGGMMCGPALLEYHDDVLEELRFTCGLEPKIDDGAHQAHVHRLGLFGIINGQEFAEAFACGRAILSIIEDHELGRVRWTEPSVECRTGGISLLVLQEARANSGEGFSQLCTLIEEIHGAIGFGCCGTRC